MVFLLCVGGTFFFSQGQEISAVNKNTKNTGYFDDPLHKPRIDSLVPAKLEMATFALG